MQTHSLNIQVAEECGVNAALIFNHIAFWVQKNIENNTNFYDGKYWTYASRNDLRTTFTYLTTEQIRYALDKLAEHNYIVKGRYNACAYKNTTWYSLSPKGREAALNNSDTASDCSVNINNTTGNVPTPTGNVPTPTGNVPTSTGNVPTPMGNVPISMGNVPTSTGNNHTPTGNIPKFLYTDKDTDIETDIDTDINTDNNNTDINTDINTHSNKEQPSHSSESEYINTLDNSVFDNALHSAFNKLTGVQVSQTNYSEDNSGIRNPNSEAPPSQTEKEFGELWLLYPKERRQGKKKALEAYKKARRKGVSFDDVKKGIENYSAQVKAEHTETRYIKQAVTWFCGECWQDEYNTSGITKKSKWDDMTWLNGHYYA